MTIEAQFELLQALAHKFDLEITRSVTSGLDLEVLDRRIEAARLLLEWLSQALEPHPSAFPEARTPPPSTVQADQDQIPQSALDPPNRL